MNLQKKLNFRKKIEFWENKNNFQKKKLIFGKIEFAEKIELMEQNRIFGKKLNLQKK